MYIEKIEVKGLWGEKDLCWELTPQVNILSGSNGSGKSTILQCLGDMFRVGRLSVKRACLVEEIVVTFDNKEQVSSRTEFNPDKYNIQVISTFDAALPPSEVASRLSVGNVVTELDWELYRLHAAYLDYQLEVSKQIIAALTAGRPTDAIIAHKQLFFDLLDSLFHSTGKIVDRDSNSLTFIVGTRRITPYQLSSGEKQILILLTTVLTRNGRDWVMIMDEPEISLHFDWQRRLIEDILLLNPQTQLIIATHSPAVVMDGWVDRVSEINELITNG